jgi:hypothetical protein
MSINFYLSGWCQSVSETQCQKLNVRDSMSETQCQRLNVRDSMSETQCQRLNVRDPIPVTQCQWPNVRVWFTNLVSHVCYTSRLCVQLGIGVRLESGFVMFSFPSLDCCKALSECRPATHSFYVLGLLHHRGTDFCGPVWIAGRPSLWTSWWCHTDGCLADMRVAECIWGSLSGYDRCQVHVDWSEWIGEDCICYIPTSTRCALTHAQWDEYSNTHCDCDANMEVDRVAKALYIDVRTL